MTNNGKKKIGFEQNYVHPTYHARLLAADAREGFFAALTNIYTRIYITNV